MIVFICVLSICVRDMCTRRAGEGQAKRVAWGGGREEKLGDCLDEIVWMRAVRIVCEGWSGTADLWSLVFDDDVVRTAIDRCVHR